MTNNLRHDRGGGDRSALSASDSSQIAVWRRDLLPRLAGLPLLPIGAGRDGKGPIDPKTGRGLSGWQTAAWTPEQIDATAPGIVTAVGMRCGPDAGRLVCFDLDGQSAIDAAVAAGCEWSASWVITRPTAPDRLKVVFQLPEGVEPPTDRKAVRSTAEGEQVECFWGSGQVVVAGLHRPSGALLEWQGGPESIQPLPAAWLALWRSCCDKPAATTTKREDRSASSELPPRPPGALLDALRQVPQFRHKNGQYHQLLGLALRLRAEVGRDGAIALLRETCCGSITDLDSYFSGADPTGINPGSVWPYLRDQWRIDISRDDLKRQQRPQDAEQRQRERPGPDQQQRQRDQPERTFESDWAEVEACADEVMAQPWPRMKQQAAIARKAAGLGISLAAAQREHLLEDALRRQRPTDQPVGPGGIFTVTPSSFAVDGVFRHGLNLLVGAAGVQKTRLSLDAIAAWLRGAAQWLDRDMPAPDTDQERHALIIGTDQGLDDWAECLLPLGLATRQGDQVTLSRQVTLYPAATGTRLDADGLTLIRHWCDAHPGGVVLVDSLAAVLPPGIDLDKPAVGGPIRALGDALGRCWGILTHHARKAAGKDQNLGVGAASGSNQIDAAVARVVGLGLLHRMEANQRVPMEGDPRRELFSTKRGGPPLHLIISGDSHGRFTNHGSAEALKQQERQERARQNLTDGRMAALDALEGTDGWMTVRDVVLAIGEVSADQYSATSGAAAAARRDLGALVRAGLAQQQRAGRESTYRASEHLNTREVEKECSDCSGLSGTGVSGVQISVQQCSDPPPEHLNTCSPGPAASEHLPEVLNGPEHRTEHPRPVAPTHLNNLNTCPPSTVAKGCSGGCSDAPDLLEPLLPVVISGPIGSAGLDQIDGGDDPAWGPRPGREVA